MDLLQLKIPVDRVRLIADAIDQVPDNDWKTQNQDELLQVIVWLRYRIALYDTRPAVSKAR